MKKIKTADDIIFSEIESDSDGYESFYRYKEVVKAIKIAQLEMLEYAVNKCAENVEHLWDNNENELFDIDKQSILKTIDEIKKELE